MRNGRPKTPIELTEAEATTMLATLRRQLERRDDSQQPNTLNEDKDASLPGVK